MNISNRSLVILLAATLLLVAAAVALTLRGPGLVPQPDGAKPAQTASVTPRVVRSDEVQVSPQGPLTIEIERNAVSASAMLVCGMYKSERAIVNRRVLFESIPLGDCSIRLGDATEAYSPVYPGDKLKCATVDTKTSCTGGIATEKAATVTVRSALGGTLLVDDVDKGALPVEGMKLPVGKRELVVLLPDGRELEWTLLVQPKETIEVTFPDPDAPIDAPELPGSAAKASAEAG